MTILAKIVRTLLGPDEPIQAVPVDRIAQRPAAPVPAAAADHPIDPASRPDERESERFVPVIASTVMTTSSGRRIAARILNVSRTGVAVEAESREVAAADVVMVGNRKVHPGRRIGLGFVFVFEKPIDARQCTPAIVL